MFPERGAVAGTCAVSGDACGLITINRCHVCSLTQLCLTLVAPWAVACRAPLPMEFSRQEYMIPYVLAVFPFPLLFFKKKHHCFAERLKLKDWLWKIRMLDGGFELPWSHRRYGLQQPSWKTLVELLPQETNLSRHWEPGVLLRVMPLWLFESTGTDFPDTPLSKRYKLISTLLSANWT